jgi:dTDP-4-dehydrorhamnose 3,5-epimerase
MEQDVIFKLSQESAPAETESRAAAPAFTLDATRDRQSITKDWQPLQSLIEGVETREVKNVLKDNGCLTEVWRADWMLPGEAVAQIFQVMLSPGAISAWHVHVGATDRLFGSNGNLKLVLYDARPDSPTHGRVNVIRCGSLRPMLIVVPPGVWHGVQNLGAEPALLLNLPDRAYRYDAPDHWRLPPDSPRIPYSFTAGPRANAEDPSRI